MRPRRNHFDHQKLAAVVDAQGRRRDWIADQLGYTKSYVSNVLNGNVPVTAEFALSFARLLDVSVDEFIEEREEVSA